jgi:Zn ribbon nucleic-acid-binding protein
MVELTATLTCPRCGHSSTETMPTDRCVFFYECLKCGSVLKPKSEDCCVFCSYANRPCLAIQELRDRANRRV